jgi:hypothetical protein
MFILFKVNFNTVLSKQCSTKKTKLNKRKSHQSSIESYIVNTHTLKADIQSIVNISCKIPKQESEIEKGSVHL